MQDEMKAGDVLLIDRNHCAGMTVRYFLPRVSNSRLGKHALGNGF
jgi:hypothetical protein